MIETLPELLVEFDLFEQAETNSAITPISPKKEINFVILDFAFCIKYPPCAK